MKIAEIPLRQDKENVFPRLLHFGRGGGVAPSHRSVRKLDANEKPRTAVFLTICLFRRRRIACFRPDVLPAGKNGTENGHLPHTQLDSEILTNQPVRKSAGNAAYGHPVCRISVFVASGINAARDGH